VHRSRLHASYLTAILTLVVAGLAATSFAESKAGARPTEWLMPETTQGFFAISNIDVLSEHWNKTQLGHLMANKAMEPFTKDLRRQFEERWSSIHDRLGITLEDMRGVPGGDACIGLIAPKPGAAALAIVVDVTGKLPNAKEMLLRVAERQAKRGAKRSEVTVEGCPDAVIQFDLPEPEEEKEAAKAGPNERSDEKPGEEKSPKHADAPAEKPMRQAFYCLTGNLLVVTDDFEILKGILGRALGSRKGDSLADHKPFQFIVNRCKQDYGDTTPQIRWFIHPLGYAEAARAATPEGQRRKGKSILEVMRNQGVGGVQGIGGFVDFDAETFELVHRTTVCAPPPYKKALKMAVLPNDGEFAPQPWVSRDVATYTTFYFDILNAFDNFGSLFDELFGQGESGVWEETLKSLKEDPSGPQIDLRADLFAHLGRRVSVLTDYQVPITTSSERLLFAIEVTNAKAVAVGIEKLFKNDPTVKKREINGQVVWEFVEDETPEPAAPVIDFGGGPAAAPAHPMRRKKKGGDEEEEERKRLLPHAAVTIWQGHLMIASHKDFLMKVIDPAEKAVVLADDAEYRRVIAALDKFDPKKKCFRFFSRTDEEYRPTYELIRKNKMPESESMLAKLLNGVFGEAKKGVARTQRIDGSQLPDYEVVRKYLGPAGMQITSEPQGWYLKGFTLTKPAEEVRIKPIEKPAEKPSAEKSKPAKAAEKPAAQPAPEKQSEDKPAPDEEEKGKDDE
jgi:hypothetical protein